MVKMQSSVMTFRLWVMLVILSILWGGSFFFVEIAIETMSPFVVAFWRVFIAAFALLLYVFYKAYDVRLLLRYGGAFLLMGLLNNVVPFSLLFWGQTEISAALASILNATTPLFTAFLAHFLTRDEKLSWGKFIGLSFGFCGVSLMLLPDLWESGINLNVLAQVACLGAALSYALASIWGKQFRELPAPLTALGQLSASSLILFPLMAFSPLTLLGGNIASEAYFSVLALALLSTSVAYILFFKILSEAGSTNISLVTMLVPVSAIALEMLFLGYFPPLLAYGGFILIAIGLLFIDGRIIGFLKMNSK